MRFASNTTFLVVFFFIFYFHKKNCILHIVINSSPYFISSYLSLLTFLIFFNGFSFELALIIQTVYLVSPAMKVIYVKNQVDLIPKNIVTNRILFYKMNGLNLIISIVHFIKQNVINSCIYNYLMNLIFLMDDVYCRDRAGLDWNL